MITLTLILIAEVTSVVITVLGFAALVLILNLILQAQKNNLDYDKKKTLQLFKYLFFILAILNTFLILEKFFQIPREIITVMFVIRAVVTIITVIYYYMDIPKFTRKEMPIVKHNKIIKNVISEFKNSTLSPEVKNEMILKLENYIESE
jgi:phosphatidylglycerophosphate synthase